MLEYVCFGCAFCLLNECYIRYLFTECPVVYENIWLNEI